MSDVITVADLEETKKHNKFHVDVITGRTGDYATNAVTGQVQKTLPATINDIDWSYVGKFADGVTFTKNTDFAIDASNTQWIYVGASPFPVVVSAGTVPSAPDYQVVHVGSLQQLSGLAEPSDLDQVYVRTFATVDEMKLGAELLPVGSRVAWRGKVTASDGIGATGRVVAGGTGSVSDGYIDLNNGLQIEPELGKFSIGYDSIRGRNFLQIYNWVDDLQIVSFADGTQGGDAHVMKLPPDIRRDSHAVLCTAGTFGGENDIDFRTYLYSDYFLLRGRSVYQDEAFQLLFDTKPSRNDGTKKDGSGGGGLSPADDVYAFDAAMSIPSNRTDTPVTFPALPVQFNQYVEIRRRSTGNVYLRLTPNVDDVTISDSASGNTLGKIDANGVTWGGRKLYSTNVTDIQAGNGNHSVSRNLSLPTAGSQVFRLAASGQILAGTLRLMAVGSGSATTAGFRHIAFQSDGTAITTQVIGVDNLEPQLHADLSLNGGILDLTLTYDGGLGGQGRFSFSVDWDSRSL